MRIIIEKKCLSSKLNTEKDITIIKKIEAIPKEISNGT